VNKSCTSEYNVTTTTTTTTKTTTTTTTPLETAYHVLTWVSYSQQKTVAKTTTRLWVKLNILLV